MLSRHVAFERNEMPVATRADASLGPLGYAGGVALVAVGAAALVLSALLSLAPPVALAGNGLLRTLALPSAAPRPPP